MAVAVGLVIFALLIVAWLVLPEGGSPAQIEEGTSARGETEELTLTNA